MRMVYMGSALDLIGFDDIAEGLGDGGRGTMRLIVESMAEHGGVLRSPDGILTDDALSGIHRLSDLDTMSVSAGVYSAVASGLGWEGDLVPGFGVLTVRALGYDGPVMMDITVGCLCDRSGTPVACIAQDEMPPGIARELSDRLGRRVTDDAPCQGSFEGLGTPETPLELDAWLAGEDLFQPVLSAFCIQQILCRAGPLLSCRSSAPGSRSGRAPGRLWTCPSG